MKAHDVVPRIAAHGLPGENEPIETHGVLDDKTWSTLIAQVRAQRLVGLLQATVEAERLEVTEAQRTQVADLHLQWCGSVLKLERTLLEVASALERRGTDFLVLKGSASAHLVHKDPSWRMFGDNDLLFPTDEFETALTVLAGLGYRRLVAPASSSFDRRFGKGATLRGPKGDELDAHRNLVFGTFGFLIDLDELFASSVHFELGGVKLRALGPETRLLHACYHAALGDPKPRYNSVRDVAQMLMTGSHEPRRVLELVRQWEAKPVVARAIQLCRDLLAIEPRSPVVDALAGYEPTSRERHAIAAYVGRDRSFSAKVIASLPYLEGVRERSALLRSAAFPSTEFAESRGIDNRLHWLSRGVRSLSARWDR